MTITNNDTARRTIKENPAPIDDPALIAKVSTQWACAPTDPPGPRQVGRFNKAWRHGLWQARTVSERAGVTTTDIFNVNKVYFNRPILDEMVAIGERYGWQVGKSTAAAICKAVEAVAEYPLVESVERLETDQEFEARIEGAKRVAESRAQEVQRTEARKAATANLIDKRPPRATRLIVAEYDEDDSDLMTDYFAHKTTRQVAIGWLTGQRIDFKQMRRAAATFEETAHLGLDQPDQQRGYAIEHRDNYSFGGGNYVKAGGQHSTGWSVRCIPVNEAGDGFVFGISASIEDRLPEAPEPSATGEVVEGEHYRIVEQYHDKRACAIWTVVLDVRTDGPTFQRNRAAAKAAGGWYYKTFRGNEGGFHFTSLEDAKAFAGNDLVTE